MKTPRRPLFLARRGYRSRRMMDLSRMLPVFGLFMLMLPLLRQSDGGLGTAGQIAYLFSAWLVMIVLALLLARQLRHVVGDAADDDAEDGG